VLMNSSKTMINEPALISWAESRLGRPFIWGETDCNVLALEALDVITNGNNVAIAKGKYHSKLGAIRFLARLGKGLADVVKEADGVEIDTCRYKTGDFLIMDHTAYEMAHVYLDGRLFSSHPETGVRLFKPVDQALTRAAFTVYRVM